MARKINYTPPAPHSCSRNQQQQGQQFTGCEHTDHLHKRFYFSSTRQLSLQACCLWTKMEQQFPKIGGPENRAQKSFQNWTYLLAEREEVFSLFYTLGSQIMTPKWAQNWDPKNGFKTAPATHSCKFHGAKATTKAHTDTHLQDRRTRIAKLVRQKIFADLKLKTHFGGQTCVARNSWLQAPPILVPKLAPFRTFGDCIKRTNTRHRDTRYRTTDDRKNRRTFPAFQYPPPKSYLTPAWECRSLFISGMNRKNENTPPSVSGSIIHTANSYALTGLEMEAVRENQGKPVRYDLTHRPLLLSSSNASHALLLLPQAAQVWARALYPKVEGCGLPAAVRARISSVEAFLTMHAAG